MKNYLNFETDIKDLELELEKLKILTIKVDFQVNTQKISQIQMS